MFGEYHDVKEKLQPVMKSRACYEWSLLVRQQKKIVYSNFYFHVIFFVRRSIQTSVHRSTHICNSQINILFIALCYMNSLVLFQKTDMALASLTITKDRQRVVDFTNPFMQMGISIMIKKPDKQKPGVFSFMDPLNERVWICVMVGFLAVSLVLFFVGRWSPYEWREILNSRDQSNAFTFSNTLWFALGALMQQGSDIFPRLVT